MMAADAIRCRKRAAPATGHHYWRLNVTNTAETGSIKVNIGEIEFRTIAGGPSVSVGGIATASSWYDLNYTPAKAFDGMLGVPQNTWLSAAGATLPQWIAYEHTSPVAAVEVMVAAGYNELRAPIDFTIDYSDDGATWTTAATVTNEAAWTAYEQRVFQI